MSAVTTRIEGPVGLAVGTTGFAKRDPADDERDDQEQSRSESPVM